MVQDIEKGIFRNLDVDEHLILPANTNIRFLFTASDVIHS
jgi:heme/copper-type cytochrome/quinol oxidase subunit 2